jgi:hypothetical protein
MYLNDLSRNMAGFRVPAYMVANFKFLTHIPIFKELIWVSP